MTAPRVIDLDWAAWDAGERAEAHQTAHDTASATAKRDWIARGSAASLHGKQVEGRTPSGPLVKGVYDHNIGKVLFKGGAATVTHVRPAAPAPANLANVHPSETTAGRKSALKRGLAIPPATPGGAPGFPITDPAHWDKARQAIGRVKNPARRAAVGRLLRKTAARFGRTAVLKQSWAAKGGSKHANDTPALEFAVDAPPRLPVTSPYDLVISRDPSDGSAIVRHRSGGFEIGRIRHDDDGAWRSSAGGQDGEAHPRQRGALLELIGTHNRGSLTPHHRPTQVVRGEPLQPPARQTPLMAALGIPAIRALATPATSSAGGARVTSLNGNGGSNGDSGNGGDGGDGPSGLGAKGQAIYRKLIARKFPPDRALQFAKRAEALAARQSAK